MRASVLEFLSSGVWHFTDAKGAAGIVRSGSIQASARRAERDHYASHLGAVAVFDLSFREAIDEKRFEFQCSNILGFLGRFERVAIGIKLSQDTAQCLEGPAGIDGYKVPTINADVAYQPLYIPYLERWHIGPILMGTQHEIHLWRISRVEIHALRHDEDWTYCGKQQSLAHAIAT